MLEQLIIKNFAIIDRLDLKFTNGFNVFTGETGAGKSIIVGALNALLGSKMTADLIKHGAHEAAIEAVFYLHRPPVQLTLELQNQGLEQSLEESLITVRRLYNRQEGGRCFVGGSPVTLTNFKKITAHLIHIHGQHEGQKLLSPSGHRIWLDSFATKYNPEFGQLLDQHRQLFSTVITKQRQLNQLKQQSSEAIYRKKVLTSGLETFAKLNLEQGEYSSLLKEETIYKDAERKNVGVRIALEHLEQSDILGRLSQVEAEFENADSPQIAAWRSELTGIRIGLKELQGAWLDALDESDYSPQRMDGLQARIAKIQAAYKKFVREGWLTGSEENTGDALIALQDRWQDEMNAAENSDEFQQELANELQRHLRALGQLGETLTRAREAAARDFESKVNENLKALGMAQARVQFQFRTRLLDQKTEIDPQKEQTALEQVIVSTEKGQSCLTGEFGPRQIELGFAPNGGPLQSLRKVASGGELSRIMLSIKNIFTDDVQSSLLVFDEVDAGIGGRTADSVGWKLSEIADNNQVMVITHLPQIASRARTGPVGRREDAHFLVEKDFAAGQGLSSVRRLQPKERIGEIARMLGGTRITAKTMAHAEELLEIRAAS